MEYEKLSFRFLEPEDLDIFLEIHDQNNIWFKKIKDPERAVFFKNARKELFFSERNKTLGAFDQENNLVATAGGFFPKDYPYWYAHNNMHRVNNVSLSSSVDAWKILIRFAEMLVKYGEENNYYSFYIQREITHQIALDKLRDRFKYPYRYLFHWEKIYPAGSTDIYRHHKFYYPEGGTLTQADTVVLLCTLKPELRIPYFENNLTLKKYKTVDK